MIRLLVQFDVDKVDENDLFATLREFGDGVKAKNGTVFWKALERVDSEAPMSGSPEYQRRVWDVLEAAREDGLRPSAGIRY